MVNTRGLYRQFDEQKRSREWNAWSEYLHQFAAKHQLYSAGSQLVSLFNPTIGLGLDVLNRMYQKFTMPNEFHADYMYTSEESDSKYEQGSKDALLELEAGMWSGLIGHLGKSMQYHGKSGFTESQVWRLGEEKEKQGQETSEAPTVDTIDVPIDQQAPNMGLSGGEFQPSDMDYQEQYEKFLDEGSSYDKEDDTSFLQPGANPMDQWDLWYKDRLG